uniref:Protein containing UPF0103/Mediator of ErbB2-driven cell motility (Memo), related domain protein n=1 Tax=uncultured organism TaxID=155900 RepID=M1PW74_9ZZZZ|nr:protein containing UPF0103/Mediator of ErbB2-driven cell motility (Memo), related domain protein [uncultured organism]
MPEIRNPAVAGRFYRGTKTGLTNQLEECFKHECGPGKIPEVQEGPRRMIGLISPHAGYPYSGPVAAHGFSKLAEDGKPDSVVIIGPNHSGVGPDVSVDSSDLWETPLGQIDLNKEIRERILEESEVAELDSSSHLNEHSLEVQLPFLQYLFDEDFDIVPICMKAQNAETSEDIGKAIQAAANGEDILIIASTDLTHYEPQQMAETKDRKAVEKIQDLNWKGLFETVSKENMSVCGYGPVASMMVASKGLGASRTELYKYATSGDTAGPTGQVVGYCSLGVLTE